MDSSQPSLNRQQFNKEAQEFLDTLFGEALRQKCGEIEIKGFQNGLRGTFYHDNISGAAEQAFQLCRQGLDVYFGVNPRVGRAGKKENIEWVVAFHAEIDYGQDLHNKKPDYESYDEALEPIRAFEIPPTWVNHSGGGFHVYWVLEQPSKVSEIGVERIEKINKALIRELKADGGTQNINRILRIPGTFNFKLHDNPREVTVIIDNGPKYVVGDFKGLLDVEEANRTKQRIEVSKSAKIQVGNEDWDENISSLPLSDRIKNLITKGNDGSYPSRSEADQAVVNALVNKGMDFNAIKPIFKNHMIGEKYRQHGSPDDYLKHNIEKAKEFSNLTEEERLNPLFISGAIHKDDSGKYSLDILMFQEFIGKKQKLKFLEKEGTFFRYNERCYEQCSEDRLNNICQTELGKHRVLFTLAMKGNFIHYAIGDELMDAEKAFKDQTRYLTMQNGLYDLFEDKLIPHDPNIFTTNLLPYDYDSDAECPRWLKYLDEVFMLDAEKIKYVQEAIGYALYKAVPKPKLFFLVGDGSNGKSVFIDVLSGLFGKDNVCNISLNKLNDEKYLPELFGKMINVSGETPNSRCMNTDLIKSVTAGDWVTGREVYKKPTKFRPYAKHYLAMNVLPNIDDRSHGMWRRLSVIEFPRTFSEKEMDVALTSKLKKELPGIFNWILDGYRRLRSQNFNFSESPTIDKSKRIYKKQSNNIIEFAESCLIKLSDVDQSLPFKEVYGRYQSFCSSEGLKQVHSKKEFRFTFEKEGYQIMNSSKHANQLRVFGVELKSVD